MFLLFPLNNGRQEQGYPHGTRGILLAVHGGHSQKTAQAGAAATAAPIEAEAFGSALPEQPERLARIFNLTNSASR